MKKPPTQKLAPKLAALDAARQKANKAIQRGDFENHAKAVNEVCFFFFKDKEGHAINNTLMFTLSGFGFTFVKPGPSGSFMAGCGARAQGLR